MSSSTAQVCNKLQTIVPWFNYTDYLWHNPFLTYSDNLWVSIWHGFFNRFFSDLTLNLAGLKRDLPWGLRRGRGCHLVCTLLRIGRLYWWWLVLSNEWLVLSNEPILHKKNFHSLNQQCNLENKNTKKSSNYSYIFHKKISSQEILGEGTEFL